MTLDDDQTTGWYLAQHKPNAHRIAARNLARQGFRTFLPVLDETRRQGGRFTARQRPLFPGHVFIALDAGAGNWRAVNSTHGVTRLVSLGTDGPTPLPPGLVAGLMQRCDEDGRLAPPPGPGAGDRVTVTGGPFAEYIGRVEEMAPDRRVWLLLDLMGQKTRIEVPAAQLRAV